MRLADAKVSNTKAVFVIVFGSFSVVFGVLIKVVAAEPAFSHE
jgi:hypothetical protein